MGKLDDLAEEKAKRKSDREDRERTICELRTKGRTIEQIASALGVGKSTVKRALLLEAARKAKP